MRGHRPIVVLACGWAVLLAAPWVASGALAGPEGGERPARAEIVADRAAPDRRMAVTVDDLPIHTVLDPDLPRRREITEAIVGALAARRVPAIGFVNEVQVVDDAGEPVPERVALLERWLDAGLDLGNHTFSHPDLHRTPPDEWLADAERGERVIRRLLAARDRELVWFRHPYLHTGRDLETRRAVEAFLAGRGMRVAPVTIDNAEWQFAAAYDRALAAGDRELAERIEAAYVPYLEAEVAYFEAQSMALFDREIPQVLLLHANALNAARLGELLDRIAARGYRFVPLAEAVADPAYESEDTYVGPAGMTWLHRWALTGGAERGSFAGEPETPGWVVEAADTPGV